MAGARGENAPDPLGKRALYGVPINNQVDRQDSHGGRSPTVTLPVGKRALYSGAGPDRGTARLRSERSSGERGVFTVRCQRCRQISRVGLLELLIFQFPVGVWVPRGQFDRRMTCPSCRKRAWCSVTLRRDD